MTRWKPSSSSHVGEKDECPHEAAIFSRSDPIISFLCLGNFKTPCNSSGIGESAAMFLSSHFIRDAGKAGFSHRLIDDIKKYHWQEDKLTTSHQLGYYISETYAAKEVIAKAQADMGSFK